MKKFIVIITSFIILFSCLIPSSAAAPFECSIAEPESFIDVLGYTHDYFVIFNDSLGYLFELVYDASKVQTTVRFLRSDLRIRFTNNSSDYSDFNIYIRYVNNGVYVGSFSLSVAPSDYYEFYYNQPDFDFSLPDYTFVPYSSFLYFYLIPDYTFTTSFATNMLLIANTLQWADAGDNSYLLSPLPEPVSDDYNRFIVFQRANGKAELWHFSCSSSFNDSSFVLQLNVYHNGQYSISIQNFSDLVDTVNLNIYQVANGFCIYSSSFTVSAYSTVHILATDSFKGLQIANYPRVKVYGIAFDNSIYHLDLPTIQWNYDLIEVEGYASMTLLLLNQLYTINRNLVQFEDSFFDEMEMVYSYFEQLLDIYNDPGFTFDQPSTAFIDDYLTDESKVFDSIDGALNSFSGSSGNLGHDLGSIFDSSTDIFNGTGAFALARYLLNGFIFDDSRIASFVFFSLAMGLAVLILGRRINA